MYVGGGIWVHIFCITLIIIIVWHFAYVFLNYASEAWWADAENIKIRNVQKFIGTFFRTKIPEGCQQKSRGKIPSPRNNSYQKFRWNLLMVRGTRAGYKRYVNTETTATRIQVKPVQGTRRLKRNVKHPGGLFFGLWFLSPILYVYEGT